jgi:hypothetical protein
MKDEEPEYPVAAKVYKYSGIVINNVKCMKKENQMY